MAKQRRETCLLAESCGNQWNDTKRQNWEYGVVLYGGGGTIFFFFEEVG